MSEITVDLEKELAPWREVSLNELIKHIVGVHHAYMKKEIPRIKGLFENLDGDLPDGLFDKYRSVAQDMKQHTFKEEDVLFPLIAEMENQTNRGEQVVCSSCTSVASYIEQMELEHDDVLEIFDWFKGETGGYSSGDEAIAEIYSALHVMHEDLKVHIAKENRILHVRAIELENSGS
jgi:regulator of cell morphogenesis and NO signaling